MSVSVYWLQFDPAGPIKEMCKDLNIQMCEQ